MRAAGRWLGVTAAAMSVAVGAAACAGASARRSTRAVSSFGHMAGYVWTGRVTAVSASWSVPRMSGHGDAHASTWIGAQAIGRPRRSPFIQVGTVEDRGSTHPTYGAFWTDTIRGFHPQILFHVHAGDAVSTGLTLIGGRWRINIADTTSGQTASFFTREEGAGGFDLAEWLQEDPGQTSGRVTHYPRLSTVRMRALAVNGTVPRYSDVFAQWMSLPGRDLAPTPLRDAAFAITRGVLTPAGRQYLAMARPQNAGARTVDLEEPRWTARTPARQIERASRAAAASEWRYAAALAGSAWPVAARAPIGVMVREVRQEAAVFAASARQAPTSLVAWRGQFAPIVPRLVQLAHEVRRALHLPELVSGPLSAASARRSG